MDTEHGTNLAVACLVLDIALAIASHLCVLSGEILLNGTGIFILVADTAFIAVETMVAAIQPREETRVLDHVHRGRRD